MITHEQKVALIRGLSDAVTEAVAAAGPAGVPGGHLYAILMTYGISLESFTKLMDTLVALNCLTKKGECYYAH